jgi:phosphate transport system protein
MERHLDQDLDRVRQELLRMAGLVEAMIGDAMAALVQRDWDKARGVIVADKGIDTLEKEIDESCHSILVRHQPTAIDLRFLVAVMKINNDLERMGDSAVNIAEAVEVLNQEPPLKPYIDLPRMAERVRAMVRDSLDAFVARDTKTAIAVCAADDEIDGFYHQLFRELLTYMIEDPKNVSRALHLLLISRNLERIADHATNIAEDVIYYVEGRDIRHSSHLTSGEVKAAV